MMSIEQREKRVLILEDETPLRELYKRRLKRLGYFVDATSNADDAIKLLGNNYHVALVDVRMPGMTGMEFLQKVKEQDSCMEIIIITAYGSIESAVKAMKAGAYDYLTKPCHLPELEMLVAKACEKSELRTENTILKETLHNKETRIKMVYRSPKMVKIINDVKKVAITDSPVIIEGESGTGKEIVAGYIHSLSNRNNGSFIAINCANLHDNLVENELFGHERGSYTGADQKRRGLMELADKGTLFIDEIGEMPPLAQAKLLRVMETKNFRRIGGSQEIHSDARIIAATNRNLSEEVKKGNFRADLFYRLNVVRLQIPPLRDRPEDIPELVDHFLELKCKTLNTFKTIKPEAKQLFLEYKWPGNVRELANIVERAIILSSGTAISMEDLPFGSNCQVQPDLVSLVEMERSYIEQVLQRTSGNKTKAAKILGVSVRNLYRKINQMQNAC